MKILLSTIALMVLSTASLWAYDVQYGNYYFNRLRLTKTENIGGVKTFYYDVEATSKEGGLSRFALLYNGPIAPPATFTVNERVGSEMCAYVYKLTRIGDMTFGNNADATELTLPSTVTEIADMGLLANMDLRKITCLAVIPPAHNSTFLLVIDDIATNGTLYVPRGTKSAYQNAAGWKRFQHIVELPPDLNGHEGVDLGLPSKKLWATVNYGASSETAYGQYVMWSSVDVVASAWGSDWATPTRSEMQELLDKCSWSWTTKNGVSGYKVIGSNGNSIFLPAAGCQFSGYPLAQEQNLFYWTSSASSYESGFAYMLVGDPSSVDAYSTYNTAITSATIRPIFRGSIKQAVDDLKADVPRVAIKDGTIVVDYAGQVSVDVTDINGRVRYHGDSRYIPLLPEGIYVVRVAGQSFKVKI